MGSTRLPLVLIAVMPLFGTVGALTIVPSAALSPFLRNKFCERAKARVNLCSSDVVKDGKANVAKSAQELFQPLEASDPSAFFAGLTFDRDEDDAGGQVQNPWQVFLSGDFAEDSFRKPSRRLQ